MTEFESRCSRCFYPQQILVPKPGTWKRLEQNKDRKGGLETKPASHFALPPLILNPLFHCREYWSQEPEQLCYVFYVIPSFSYVCVSVWGCWYITTSVWKRSFTAEWLCCLKTHLYGESFMGAEKWEVRGPYRPQTRVYSIFWVCQVNCQ